ncbi:hypothetical protein ACN38_g11971 [Penicillium nordicum]|uniref:Uncharacterized protein n=1 Tax=Penicillium nordicum TaxID=229535 RepID=A0A0M9WAA4_9EURO|nr:hypothetical protein ACN38_g11971 [Penicillium nordicum]
MAPDDDIIHDHTFLYNPEITGVPNIIAYLSQRSGCASWIMPPGPCLDTRPPHRPIKPIAQPGPTRKWAGLWASP